MFNQFLREQGYGEKWSNSIYPLMKRTLIGKNFLGILINIETDMMPLYDIKKYFISPIAFRYTSC